ncbi:MAG: bifunctional DNA-formamidopyrimidine glycosylase/DNA-(apurinic or apyrimidinic site) lyase [candidate division Zixibacteria bacterium]|nr:bifunctional DNA-formamidopyrimidine glycosylase/DNA-(apurinic or apyrimidinic site) lyase [candidate division Zixibacteria bacterium]
MPELPEVETVVRGLRRTVLNQIIDSLYINSPRIARAYFEGDIDKLRGKKFIAIRRRGKNILMDLSDGHTLWVHLKMTGHFYYLPKKAPIDKHDHLIFYFRDSHYSLHFNDYRRFGRVRLLKTGELSSRQGLNDLGPEPLEIKPDAFIALFRSAKRMIKPALLDQTFLAGLGNIYADEALYLARIHPKRSTDSLPKKKLEELYRAIQQVLRKAINKMGTSVDTFAGVDGKPGGFQHYLKAYGREGEPCFRCGAAIRRQKIGSRSAHYCPRCQRLR